MNRFSEAVRESRAKNLKDGQKAIEVANEAAVTAEERGEVVFYAWIDAGTQSMPSSVTIHIGRGGERVRDAESGRIVTVGYKEVRFNMGILRTDDQEVIAELRKHIKNGDTITEDKEVYLSKVEKPELRAARLSRVDGALREESKRKDKEIADLKAKLAAVSAPTE